MLQQYCILFNTFHISCIYQCCFIFHQCKLLISWKQPGNKGVIACILTRSSHLSCFGCTRPGSWRHYRSSGWWTICTEQIRNTWNIFIVWCWCMSSSIVFTDPYTLYKYFTSGGNNALTCRHSGSYTSHLDHLWYPKQGATSH
jgi:hypothetical protein